MWHHRLGHVNAQTLENMKCKEIIKGLEFFYDKNNLCLGCIKGKQTRTSFSNYTSHTSRKLELIHSYICGLMHTPSMGGARYFATFIDDFSRMTFVYLLKSKS